VRIHESLTFNIAKRIEDICRPRLYPVRPRTEEAKKLLNGGHEMLTRRRRSAAGCTQIQSN
jgi:hypothetical protein